MGLRGASQTSTKQGFHGFKKRLRLQNHSLAASEGPVIHAPVAIFGKHAQILYMHFDEPCLLRSAHNAVIKRSGKKFRKNSNQIKTHVMPV
jgi:hypothetical protein